jgi:hypothetical protein
VNEKRPAAHRNIAASIVEFGLCHRGAYRWPVHANARLVVDLGSVTRAAALRASQSGRWPRVSSGRIATS